MPFLTGNTFGPRFDSTAAKAARIKSPGHFKGEDIGYTGAHYRARQELDLSACSFCRSTRNVQAALMTGMGTNVDSKGRPYSVVPTNYIPLCVPCHRTYDAEALR